MAYWSCDVAVRAGCPVPDHGEWTEIDQRDVPGRCDGGGRTVGEPRVRAIRDFKSVHRCGVLTAESRAGQYKYPDIERAAAHLHGMIDRRRKAA
jgi:hypothetical protein